MMTELKVRRVLLATDLLANSRLALDYAVAIAYHFKSVLSLLHVVQLSNEAQEAELITERPSVSRKEAMGRLDNLAHSINCKGLEIDTYVEDGTPCEVILHAVSARRADLLVLGVHGVHRGVGHLLIGSNTEKILQSASCPTLTIGPNVLAGYDLPRHLNEIVYFSDFSPQAAAAAPYAILLGREFHVPVDVGQLMPDAAKHDPELRKKLVEEYCETVCRLIPNSDPEWCAPHFHLERGIEIDQMLHRAEAKTAGLIVLGIRTRSQLGRHIHTSVAYRLLAGASCPVLSVGKHGEF